MGTWYQLYLSSLFVMLSATEVIHIHAMKFQVINRDKGTFTGAEFEREITTAHAMKTMESAYNLVESKVYKLDNPFCENKIDTINFLVVEDTPPAFYQYVGFFITAEYFEESSFNLKEFEKRIYIAMTRLFLSVDKHNKFPEELKAAIVAFVLLEAGYAEHDWAKPGEGDSWYQKSDVTAQFFKFCETQKTEFVPKMIKDMKTYSSTYLKKHVDPLWIQYKNFYRGAHDTNI